MVCQSIQRQLPRRIAAVVPPAAPTGIVAGQAQAGRLTSRSSQIQALNHSFSIPVERVGAAGGTTAAICRAAAANPDTSVGQTHRFEDGSQRGVSIDSTPTGPTHRGRRASGGSYKSCGGSGTGGMAHLALQSNPSTQSQLLDTHRTCRSRRRHDGRDLPRSGSKPRHLGHPDSPHWNVCRCYEGGYVLEVW